MKAHCIKISDTLHIEYHETYSLGWTWALIASNYGTCLYWTKTKQAMLDHIELEKKWGYIS